MKTDTDISAFCVTNGFIRDHQDFVFYNNKANLDGSVTLSKSGNRHVITINDEKVSQYDKIQLFISVHSEKEEKSLSDVGKQELIINDQTSSKLFSDTIEFDSTDSTIAHILTINTLQKISFERRCDKYRADLGTTLGYHL